jgi:aminoglycoside phosphotransferase (APT) family kinase protein
MSSEPLTQHTDPSSEVRALSEAVPVALERWFGEKLPAFVGSFELTRLGEGQSCLTYLVHSSEWSLVLRRPPLGVHPRGAFDVTREYQVMRALNHRVQGIPVPQVLALCTDEDILGAPFYVMERVRGAVLRDALPVGTTAPNLSALGVELIRTLTAIHDVSVAEAGLVGLAPEEGYLTRQLGRLQSQWDHLRRRAIPVLDELGSWVRQHAPDQSRTTLIHGDYKLDNVVVGLPESPAIRAILDWELSTLGDPLADLGWLLYFWREAGEEPFAIPVCSVTDRRGFPTRRDLVELYARGEGFEPARMNWYIGLAGWKISIIMETSYQRYRDGYTEHPTFARLDTGVPHMAERALALATAPI